MISRKVILISVSTFIILTIYVIVQHELHLLKHDSGTNDDKFGIPMFNGIGMSMGIGSNYNTKSSGAQETPTISRQPPHVVHISMPTTKYTSPPPEKQPTVAKRLDNQASNVTHKGSLVCNGVPTDSEIVYWKVVPGDSNYESPITPHHGVHHDRYITFEYDEGGWNNVRMGMECLVVIAHAMGRTLVVPPQQHLYLLGKEHQGKDEMGFEDFFDMDLLKSHEGLHVISTKEFLEREGITGGLKGKYPPGNNTDLWGPRWREYLRDVADEMPAWSGKFIYFPKGKEPLHTPENQQRLKEFGGERTAVYYDENLQKAHHIHFQGGGNHRLLQHFYAFAYFEDIEMQTFEKRLIRDYMRYKDYIQCAGHEVLQMVRADARRHNPDGSDHFYALHVRRGDFQFKEVKLSADQILKNLVVNGQLVIPNGSLVYLSTDDPRGICEHCLVQRKPCPDYPAGSKPVGCPEDSSWEAFRKAGWTLRFLDDYLKRGAIKGANPNIYGMVESIVCSKAKVFAGTFFSTFTGYIYRLRGYHGLGEDTYYHSTNRVSVLRQEKSMGHGFSREYRYGFVDDNRTLI